MCSVILNLKFDRFVRDVQHESSVFYSSFIIILIFRCSDTRNDSIQRNFCLTLVKQFMLKQSIRLVTSAIKKCIFVVANSSPT